MPRLILTTRDDSKQTIDSQTGFSVMEVIRRSNVQELVALCGGSCSCATCHVYVDPEFSALLPPMHGDEDELLEASSHRTPQSRLSCQIPFTDKLDGLRVTIAPED